MPQHPVFDLIQQHTEAMKQKREALASVFAMALNDMAREEQAFYKRVSAFVAPPTPTPTLAASDNCSPCAKKQKSK